MIFQECTLPRFSFEKQKSGRRFARFSRLGFLWELVIREERFWNFYGGVVTRRHSFGFSRNNMKGALYHWKKSNGCETPKMKNWKFFIFGVLKVGVEPLTQRPFLSETKKMGKVHTSWKIFFGVSGFPWSGCLGSVNFIGGSTNPTLSPNLM